MESKEIVNNKQKKKEYTYPYIHINYEDGVGIYPDLNRDCSFCKGKKTYICYYWYSKCNRCGASSDTHFGGQIRAFRNKIGLSRKEFAPLFKITPATLKKYEFGNPSDRVRKEYEKFVENYFKKSEVKNGK